MPRTLVANQNPIYVALFGAREEIFRVIALVVRDGGHLTEMQKGVARKALAHENEVVLACRVWIEGVRRGLRFVLVMPRLSAEQKSSNDSSMVVKLTTRLRASRALSRERL